MLCKYQSFIKVFQMVLKHQSPLQQLLHDFCMVETERTGQPRWCIHRKGEQVAA